MVIIVWSGVVITAISEGVRVLLAPSIRSYVRSLIIIIAVKCSQFASLVRDQEPNKISFCFPLFPFVFSLRMSMCDRL